MGAQYVCKNLKRREVVRNASFLINGVDFLEVAVLAHQPTGKATLLLYFVKSDGVNDLSSADLSLTGGVRITGVTIEWAYSATWLVGCNQPSGWTYPSGWNVDQANDLADLLGISSCATEMSSDRILVVRTSTIGDRSTYRLEVTATQIVTSADPVMVDPQLTGVDFVFDVEKPSEFDCASNAVASSTPAQEPSIDYLARDYASLRRLMLDRLTVLAPDWKERNAADLGMAVVEVLAYTADYLSYYQDAVATEAYLGTARRRVSVRRHARLLDYPMHDGCNARAWVALEIGDDLDALALHPRNSRVQLLTGVDTLPISAFSDEVEPALVDQAQIFEPLHTLTLYTAYNEIRFYTWGDDGCCLKKGSTGATLRDTDPRSLSTLAAGSLLLLEEARGPESGDPGDADPSHRQVVRLTSVTPMSDPVYEVDSDGSLVPYTGSSPNMTPVLLVEVAWSDEDALTFDLCVHDVADPEDPDAMLPVSVARGNVLLCDHGRTLSPVEALAEVSGSRFRPKLERGPVTQQRYVRTSDSEAVVYDPDGSAASALEGEMRDVLPAITLNELDADDALGTAWSPRRDLLNSDGFANEFVAETEDDDTTTLRFGDDVYGKKPADGTRFVATYRIGNGASGNVGGESIAHALFTDLNEDGSELTTNEKAPYISEEGLKRVWNPLPALGGMDPETIDEVKLYAPRAFRSQARAVTAEDYATIARTHPEVQNAVATLRWTGTWQTLFLSVDRRGGLAVDAAFKSELLTWLERYRLLGHDVEVEAPNLVPLDIAITIHVVDGYSRTDIRDALLETFSTTDLADGTRGFFHPDDFTFGQSVYVSQVVARAAAITGVSRVDSSPSTGNHFRRAQLNAPDETLTGRIAIGRTEIIRLDNDPQNPENGKITFHFEGGL